MSNSPWKDFKDNPPPEGKTVLLYLSKEKHGSKFAIYKSIEISNGYLTIIDNLFHWDFDMETILCWRYMNDLEGEVPMKYVGEL